MIFYGEEIVKLFYVIYPCNFYLKDQRKLNIEIILRSTREGRVIPHVGNERKSCYIFLKGSVGNTY